MDGQQAKILFFNFKVSFFLLMYIPENLSVYIFFRTILAIFVLICIVRFCMLMSHLKLN